MTHPTPYPDLHDVLRELVESVQVVLGNAFIAAYLQGSFAVGDYDRHSDVDFIIAIEQELSGDQVHALQTLHKRIYSLDCEWAQHLEGSYFPKDVLRSYSQRGKPLWYLDNGSRSLVPSEHDNTVVVRWVVREHDLHTGFPGSKRAGAEWAKATLDPSWAGLIDRAWDGRPNPAVSVRQPADPQDLKSTLEFIPYIIQASTQVAAALETL
jgi:hypothetical protein